MPGIFLSSFLPTEPGALGGPHRSLRGRWVLRRADPMGQPGNNAGEAFSDAAAYAAQHAAAEILDIGAAYAPFPANYILDKASDFVRPSESTYQEYADKH